MRLCLLYASATLALAGARVGQAQRLLPSTTGISLAGSVGVVRSSAESQGITTSSQRTARRGELAYGVSPRVSIVAALGTRTAQIEEQDFDVRSVDMGVRYLGFAGRAMRPFAEGGLSVRTFSLEATVGEVRATNVGPWAAAGYMFFPGGGFALEVAATYGRVTFENWRAGGNAVALAPVGYRELGVRAGARWFVRGR